MAFEKISTDLWVTTLKFMIHGFADVVQQAAPPAKIPIQSHHLRQHAGDKSHLDAMAQYILAVACAKIESTQHLDDAPLQPMHVHLLGRFFAFLLDTAFHLLRRLDDQLLDPRRMDTTVGDQLVQSLPGDLTTHGIETADDDDPRRVVDDDVDTRGFLERPNVPTFPADDPPLHLVAGDIHRTGGRLRGVRGGIPLQGRQQDLAGLLVTHLLK